MTRSIYCYQCHERFDIKKTQLSRCPDNPNDLFVMIIEIFDKAHRGGRGGADAARADAARAGSHPLSVHSCDS